MNSRMLKISGLGVVVIAAVILFTRVGGGTVVLGDVLEHIQQESYRFTLTIRSGPAGSTLRGMVHQKGRARFDSGFGAATQSTIVDLESRKCLLLSHPSKAARYVEGLKELTHTGADRLLLLCSQPVESLWRLRDGTEDDLGTDVIGGTKARGFRIVHEDEYFRNEITLWAALRSGRPVRVEIASQALKPPRDRLDFTLEDFETASDLDEGLFSLEVPPGYALSGQASPPAVTSEDQSSDEARKIAKVFQLWQQGRSDEALDLLLQVDWDQPMAFTEEPCVFALTERGVAALEQADRELLMPVILDSCNQLRKICFALVDRAKEARSARDDTQAEACLAAAVHLGELATRNPEGMFIAQLTGIAARKLGLVQLKSLYEETNAAEKLVDTELKIQQVDAAHQALVKRGRGQ